MGSSLSPTTGGGEPSETQTLNPLFLSISAGWEDLSKRPAFLARASHEAPSVLPPKTALVKPPHAAPPIPPGYAPVTIVMRDGSVMRV